MGTEYFLGTSSFGIWATHSVQSFEVNLTTPECCRWAGPWENVSYVICEQQRRRSDCASAQSDQRLCFCCLDSIISLDSIAEISRLASLCSCAGRFVSGLVGNSWRHIFSWRGSDFFMLVYLNLSHPYYTWATTRQNLSLGVSEEARHNPACAATEAS